MSVNRLDRWIGRDRLRPDQIDGNRFLKAWRVSSQIQRYNTGEIDTVAKICHSSPTASISTIWRHPDP